MRRTFGILFIAALLGSFFYISTSGGSQSAVSTTSAIKNSNVGVVAAADPLSVSDLQNDYSATGTEPDKLQILIVPGHEPDFGGTSYGNLFERDLVVELGQDLQSFIERNTNYKVTITRDTKSWNPIFADYFKNNMDAILAWEKAAAKDTSYLTSLGEKTAPPSVIHNNAPVNVASRLYGITKWANENKIDLTIHIHLNDYPGRPIYSPGKYSGIVIYVPAKQYSNSSTTHAIANTIFKRLSLYNPTSNLKGESKGVIDDSELIAVGANNTSDAASMLIEYNYIYEPQFVNPQTRSIALKDLAYQTLLGIQDYFTKNEDISLKNAYSPTEIYNWNVSKTGKNSSPQDIYALQTALLLDGDYPPTGMSMNSCPHSGVFGPCTSAALETFQKRHGIIDEIGFAGKKSTDILSAIYFEKTLVTKR